MIGFGAGLPRWAFFGAGVASSTPAVGSTALTPGAVPAPPPPPHPLSATSSSRAGPTGLLGTRPSFSTDRLDEGLHDELRLEHGAGGVDQRASGGGLRRDRGGVGAAYLGAGGNGVDEPRALVLVGDQLAERLEGAPVGLGLLLEVFHRALGELLLDRVGLGGE